MISCLAFVCLIGAAAAGPQKSAFWKGTPMDQVVEQMRSNCDSGADSLACMKFKVATFLDSVFKQDNYKLFEDVEVRQNGNAADQAETEARAAQDQTIVDTVERYIESHDVTFSVPAAAAKVTVSPRNINDNELNLKIKFAPEGRSAVEGMFEQTINKHTNNMNDII